MGQVRRPLFRRSFALLTALAVSCATVLTTGWSQPGGLSLAAAQEANLNAGGDPIGDEEQRFFGDPLSEGVSVPGPTGPWPFGMDPYTTDDPVVRGDLKKSPMGDFGLDPNGGLAAAFNDLSMYQGLVSSTKGQAFDPRYPEGKDHLPRATVDKHPFPLRRLERKLVDGVRVRQLNAYSPSMETWIPLVWVVPQDQSAPRPTAYFLPGNDGGTSYDNWLTRTDLIEFMSSRNVNVIIPALGAFSGYLDWEKPAPHLGGKQQWETFMTHELPLAVEEAIGANGQRSLVGLSMTAGAALVYASHKPNFYSSVASVSGCAANNSWLGRRMLSIATSWGEATITDMLGEVDGDYSRYNDVLLNFDRLRQQDNIYVFTATGLLDEPDLNGPNEAVNSERLKDRMTIGFVIETTVNACSHRLYARAAEDGAQDEIYWDFRKAGSHSWGYWDQALKDFWPIMAQGFGIDGGPINVAGPVGEMDVLSSAGSSRRKVEEFLFRGGLGEFFAGILRTLGLGSLADAVGGTSSSSSSSSSSTGSAGSSGSSNFEGSDSRTLGSTTKRVGVLHTLLVALIALPRAILNWLHIPELTHELLQTLRGNKEEA